MGRLPRERKERGRGEDDAVERIRLLFFVFLCQTEKEGENGLWLPREKRESARGGEMGKIGRGAVERIRLETTAGVFER